MARSAPRLMVAALAMALAGCNRGGEGAPLVAVIGDQPPALGTAEQPPADAASAVLRSAVAQGLVRLDGSAQIEAGLAERWNVSDDGLSYIFRLQNSEWPDGRPVRARDVARILTKLLRGGATDPVRDAAGAIAEVVPMTDRVIEIRLKAPRSNLLTILAQPEFAIVREGVGSGPFTVEKGDGPALHLIYRAPGFDGEPGAREDVRLEATPAAKGIAAFKQGEVALLLGGTVADLPLARSADLQRGTLQFDPVAGLFGIAPARETAITKSAEVRALLGQAIDRQALLAALSVPGLGPRATVLEGGLIGVAAVGQPAWLATPLAERKAALKAKLAPLLPAIKDGALPKVKLLAPAGPGGDMIVARLALDWGAMGLAVERAKNAREADFVVIDEVAPSDSPAWFVRRFHCGRVPICDTEVDRMADEARTTLLPEARNGLLTLAAQRIDGEALFIAITAPIRWSLVDRSLPGFTPNRYARHSLIGLAAKPEAVR